jgi:hypothetical protein
MCIAGGITRVSSARSTSVAGYSQTPKHGMKYAKHDPPSLTNAAGRSTNSIQTRFSLTSVCDRVCFPSKTDPLWTVCLQSGS